MTLFSSIIISSFLYSIYFFLLSKNYRIHTYIHFKNLGIKLRFKNKKEQYFLYYIVILFFHLSVNLSYVLLLLLYIYFLILKKYNKSLKTFIIERYLKNFERTKNKYYNEELLDQI